MQAREVKGTVTLSDLLKAGVFSPGLSRIDEIEEES